MEPSEPPCIRSSRKRPSASICESSPIRVPTPETYYRSDHFSFARVGIPAFSIEGGEDLLGKPPGTGKKLFDDFEEHRYHQPSDQYSEELGFLGYGAVCALRFSDRRERRERSQAADVARRGRVSSSARWPAASNSGEETA